MKCAISILASLLLLVPCRAAELPNAADVYRRAFEAMPKLTDAENKLLRGEASDANAAELSSKLAPALANYRQAARMENCDWGFDLEQTGPDTRLPHLSSLRQLSRAAVWEADRVKSSDPAAFVAWQEDLLRASTHAGQGDALICGLVEASIRQTALNAICTNLTRLPPELLAKLGEDLHALPQMHSFQNIMLAEKAFGVDWLMRRLFELQHEQLAAAAATNFAATLRLSAVVSGGPLGLKIGLEDLSGDNFWLGLGQRRHGIELVSADIREGRAVLFKGNQTAVVHLQDKSIEPINIKLINDNLLKLLGGEASKELLAGVGSNSTQLVRQMLEAADMMTAIAASAGTPVKDPEAWGKNIEAATTNNNVFARLLLPAVGRARARLDAVHAQELMLQVAVDVAREGPAAAARSRDPWGDGAPFLCCETATGYEIVSQLQRDGKPVTLAIPRR